MKPACKNHPDRNATALGLCSACYMRQRRAKKREADVAFYDQCMASGIKGVATRREGRAPAGIGVAKLLPIWDADLDSKFLAKIDMSAGSDGCHIWRGGRTKGGYGTISLGGHFVLAHRMAHALETGDALAEVVMHTCDNPSCVNPRHLRSGTHMENMRDMASKGRAAKPKTDHLRDRTRHPAARAVQTPFGEFPSATLAAEALGLHHRAVSRYCQLGELGDGYWRAVDNAAAPGWRYL